MYLYRRIVQSKIYIDKHFADPLISDHIAGEASFSKFHFIRLFKKIYDLTPHQYLIKVRVDHAKLLLAGDNRIADVCFAVGFESVSSFTGLFKKVTGQTPSSFQIERRAAILEISKFPLKYIPGCFSGKSEMKNSNFQEVIAGSIE